jgi:hypothetical protein
MNSHIVPKRRASLRKEVAKYMGKRTANRGAQNSSLSQKTTKKTATRSRRTPNAINTAKGTVKKKAAILSKKLARNMIRSIAIKAASTIWMTDCHRLQRNLVICTNRKTARRKAVLRRREVAGSTERSTVKKAVLITLMDCHCLQQNLVSCISRKTALRKVVLLKREVAGGMVRLSVRRAVLITSTATRVRRSCPNPARLMIRRTAPTKNVRNFVTVLVSSTKIKIVRYAFDQAHTRILTANQRTACLMRRRMGARLMKLMKPPTARMSRKMMIHRLTLIPRKMRPKDPRLI